MKTKNFFQRIDKKSSKKIHTPSSLYGAAPLPPTKMGAKCLVRSGGPGQCTQPDIFESYFKQTNKSSKLKAQTSLLPHFSEKRRTSFEL